MKFKPVKALGLIFDLSAALRRPRKSAYALAKVMWRCDLAVSYKNSMGLLECVMKNLSKWFIGIFRILMSFFVIFDLFKIDKYLLKTDTIGKNQRWGLVFFEMWASLSSSFRIPRIMSSHLFQQEVIGL